MNQINVPLSKLGLSALNVRKTSTGGIAELAASIHAHGLLQNLTVIDRGETFEVVAGGMRLRALQDLAKRELIASDYGVPCNVISEDEAHEASLTENVTRSAMHPADEFDAFYRLAEDGVSVADIATRFGKTECHVQQRLRLARVAPAIMEDYRAGKATLEQLMALALTDDQARQLRVWKAARAPWEREPHNLREAVVEGESSIESGIGKFVGAAAYEKAGGVVRRDLFGSDEDSYLTDPELVDRLAREKLERTAEKIRKEGWAWVEARPQFGYEEEKKFGTIYPSRKGSKEVWTDEQKEHAGAVVTIAHNGQTEINRGLVRPEDRKAAKQSTGAEPAGGRKAPERKPGELSFAAAQRLQAEAGQIVAVEVARTPGTALRLLAAELADFVFYSGSVDAPRAWVNITRRHSGRMPGNVRREVEHTPAAQQFAAIEKDWREKLPKKRSELRAWIFGQELPQVHQLLAFLVARETEVVDMAPGVKHGVVDLAEAAKVNLHEHWRPSIEWLGTLPKSTVLALAKDAGVPAPKIAELTKAPRAKLVELIAAELPPGWLPKPLRGSAPGFRVRKPKTATAAKRPHQPSDDKAFPWSINE